MKNVATEGMTLELTATTGSVSAGWENLTTISTKPSENMKVDEAGVYAGDISVTIATINTNVGVFTGVSFTLKASSKFSKLDGKPLLLDGDSGTTVAEGSTKTTPPSPTTDTFTLKVSNAGQNAVKAE